MIYPITVYGSPVLRKKASPVEKEMEGLEEFKQNMWETMYYADGAGLAAPQVGKSLRLFVVDASTGADEEPELKDFKKIFINPEIIETHGEKWIMNEGCLSLPEIREDVARPEYVTLRYQDEHFEEHVETFKGYASRIIQHEYDHLEGVLFIDYLTPLKKRLLKKKLLHIAKGKIKPRYRISQPVKQT
jgi:peptide deformylase